MAQGLASQQFERSPSWIRSLATVPAGAASIDEFNDASFTGWTTVTVTGGQTVTEGQDRLSVEATGAIQTTDLNAILQAYSISVGEAVEIAISSVLENDALQWIIAPIITDGTTTTSAVAAAMAQFWSGALDDELYLYPSGPSATLTANGINTSNACTYMGGFVYLRIEYDAANTFKCWVSIDGVTWTQFGSNISRTMTPTHVGVGFNTTVDTPVIATFSIEYIRVVTV